jgi:hypothetical protein
MLKRSVYWAPVLVLVAGGGLALSQTNPTTIQRPTTSSPQAPGSRQLQYYRGQLVRVDPGKGVVVIRSGTGAQQRDMMYLVGKSTRYFGADNKALADGLRYNGFRQGANVWYSRMTAPGQTFPNNLNVLRLAPAPGTPFVLPGTNPGGVPKPGTPGAPGSPPPPGAPKPGGPTNPGGPGRLRH